MRTRFLRGTTQENNGLTLANGELSVDLERKAVRLHDGATPGGFEMVGTPIDFPVPGPDTLVGGDTTSGFYGEIAGSELITYGDLSTTLGVSQGTLIFDNESQWLKFALDGKTLFVSKKATRHSITWEYLYQAGIVYGNDTTGYNPSGAAVTQDVRIVIKGKTYIVRLFKGANTDPTDGLGWDPTNTHTSEWNRLMYPIHSGVHTQSNNPIDPSVPYAQWATYSDTELGIYDGAIGAGSWCQETMINETARRFLRGGQSGGITYANRIDAVTASNSYGWRPVLELVE